jgi:hypothetical protein
MQITRSSVDTEKGPARLVHRRRLHRRRHRPRGDVHVCRRQRSLHAWHGAAPNRFRVHIAMQPNDESGSPVTWGEHVTDELYGEAPTS